MITSTPSNSQVWLLGLCMSATSNYTHIIWQVSVAVQVFVGRWYIAGELHRDNSIIA
jgi:hypothetical protein